MWRTLLLLQEHNKREREDRRPRAKRSEKQALWFVVWNSVGGLFLPLFTFFPKNEKKLLPPSSSSRNTFASVLVLSNVATYIHSSHYGKFKLSSRFSRGGSNSRRDARDGGTRTRSRTVSRARGGFRDLGDKFVSGFPSPFLALE